MPSKREYEVKHVTYVQNPHQKGEDALIVKEVVHENGKLIPNLRIIKNYKRPFWVTHKGKQTHKEKKDYEYVSNLTRYECTQSNLVDSICKVLKCKPAYSLKAAQQSPYVYGSEVNTVTLVRDKYKTTYPDAFSLNTVAGGDIETDVTGRFGEDTIICMSVSHKSSVLLVYLKDWVSDVVDIKEATLKEANRLIPNLIKDRNLTIDIKVVNSPAKIVVECLNQLHRWKPDWFSFWNMDFDISKMIRALHKEGINPAQVFSDAKVPEEYKYFEYIKANTQKTTASGKVLSINIEDRWNWVVHPATFQCIDALAVYRLTRIAYGKDSSYSLDSILRKELNKVFEIKIESENDKVRLKEFIDNGNGGFVELLVNGEIKRDIAEVAIGDSVVATIDYSKLKIPELDKHKGIDWHKHMQEKYKAIYGVYNIVDSIRLEQLDEATQDLSLNISTYSKSSDYRHFNSNPRRLCDDLHFWYLKRPTPSVIGTSAKEMETDLDKYVVGHKDWIVTLPSYMDSGEGLNCLEGIGNHHTLAYTHVADADLVSTYPTVSQILNIGRETVAMELCKIKGIPEPIKRSIGVNITGGTTNAVEICKTALGLPSLTAMYKLYTGIDENANESKIN